MTNHPYMVPLIPTCLGISCSYRKSTDKGQLTVFYHDMMQHGSPFLVFHCGQYHILKLTDTFLWSYLGWSFRWNYMSSSLGVNNVASFFNKVFLSWYAVYNKNHRYLICAHDSFIQKHFNFHFDHFQKMFKLFWTKYNPEYLCCAVSCIKDTDCS